MSAKLESIGGWVTRLLDLGVAVHIAPVEDPTSQYAPRYTVEVPGYGRDDSDDVEWLLSQFYDAVKEDKDRERLARLVEGIFDPDWAVTCERGRHVRQVR